MITERPPDGVQLPIQWFNVVGELHGLDMGKPPLSELFPHDFGEIIAGASPCFLKTQPSSMQTTRSKFVRICSLAKEK